MFQLLASQVHPKDLRQWVWDDGAKTDVAQGRGKVLVVVDLDSKDVIGVAWFTTYTPKNPPRMPPIYPKGYNITEAEKIIVPRVAWIRNVVETYGKCICTSCRRPVSSSRPTVAYCRLLMSVDLQEIFIAKDYHGIGIGKQLMVEIINEAKESGCNITLTAGPGMFI